jgi:hypothetical protein
MELKTHKDIMALWPTITAFGRDIGVSPDSAGQMAKRNNIAPDHWFTVIAAAKRRGFTGITLELLLCLRQARKQSREKKPVSCTEQTPARALAS